MTRFQRALSAEPQSVPPIWLMRQAGRYHRHYQALRKRHSFDALCRTPELAAQVALGPVEDFDFDSAILFSDLLYPLDALGLRVRYTDAGPRIDARLTRDVNRPPANACTSRPTDCLSSRGVRATRALLPADKGLIGFVGGPWTLFVYAIEGTHEGALATAKTSLPLYRAFTRRLAPLLEQGIASQLAAGADMVMVFDTAAGELPADVFRRIVAPDLSGWPARFRAGWDISAGTCIRPTSRLTPSGGRRGRGSASTGDGISPRSSRSRGADSFRATSIQRCCC